MNKEEKKFFRRKAGYFFLRLTVLISRVLPLRLASCLGKLMGWLAFWFSKKHRKIALESLRIAFPALPDKKIKNIAVRSFEFFSASSWELFSFIQEPRLIDEKVAVEGLDNLKLALSKGKGVVAVTAHMGNFPLMSMKLRKMGFTVNIMARPLRHEESGALVHNLRQGTGVKTIFSYPRKTAVFNSLKALKNNEILILQMDQNFGTGGVWVKFFGRLAATPVGPIVFALRSKAALLPMFIVQENGRHRLCIEKEYRLKIKEDRDETVLVNAIGITSIIEKWVRDYPWQWGWIHRRWKSQPSEKVSLEKFKVQKD